MGLEVVVNEINEQGRRQANAIKVEGLEEARRILEEAKAKAEAIIAAKAKEAQRDAERLVAQERARAGFEAKKKVLFAKRALWDRLRAEAERQLADLPEAKRREHLEALFRQVSDQVTQGVAHVAPGDAALAKRLSGLDVVGDLDGRGGLVVDSASGDISIDLRYEALLESAWSTILKEENAQLFG